jgi:diaminohydroxyphosphoribosylaminopyrimidine deaminase/5-amino-6-(5-phosphoribosylamino)uracil reductase
VIADDPLLTARYPGVKKHPVKVILDSRLRVSPRAKIFLKKSPAPVILAVTKNAGKNKRNLFKGKAEILEVKEKNGRVDLVALLSVLAKRGILRVMIEGGGEVISEAFKEKVVRELYCFVAPKIIGGRQAKNSVGGDGVSRLKDVFALKNMSIKKIGQDILIHGRF